jgi:hypothetical protein
MRQHGIRGHLGYRGDVEDSSLPHDNEASAPYHNSIIQTSVNDLQTGQKAWRLPCMRLAM